MTTAITIQRNRNDKMALYYGKTLVAGDGDYFNTNNVYQGDNTFNNILPLNDTPLTTDESQTPKFFVQYDGALRVVDFDTLYQALKSKLEADNFGSTGGTNYVSLGDEIGKDMSIYAAS